MTAPANSKIGIKIFEELYFKNKETALITWLEIIKLFENYGLWYWFEEVSSIEEIKEYYNNCPEGQHVDHIYPLKGEYVSGLHVIENLQYLDAFDNMSKGNKYIPT